MTNRITELARKAGMVAPHGSDTVELRDFDYRDFAQSILEDVQEVLRLVPYDRDDVAFGVECPFQEAVTTHFGESTMQDNTTRGQVSYLTAQDARKLANAARDLSGEYKRKETEEILVKIQAAAAGGGVELTVNVVDTIINRRLEQLGFSVTVWNGDQRDGPTMTVKWDI